MIKIANAFAPSSILACAKPVEVKSNKIKMRAATPKFDFVVILNLFSDDKIPPDH